VVFNWLRSSKIHAQITRARNERLEKANGVTALIGMDNTKAHPHAMLAPGKEPPVPRRRKLAADNKYRFIFVTSWSEHVEFSTDTKALYSRAETSLAKQASRIPGCIDHDVGAHFDFLLGPGFNQDASYALGMLKDVKTFRREPNSRACLYCKCREVLINPANIHHAHHRLIVLKCGGTVRRHKSHLPEGMK